MGTQIGRAADTVAQKLAQRIRTGGLADGQALPSERDLMEEFGTSRTVVREAVRQLSAQGIIEAKPRHRPVVRRAGFEAALDAASAVVSHLLEQPEGVKNLFDTRTMVEAALVRQAATDARKQDIAALRHALDANAAVVENSELFYQTDMRFHGVLYQIPNNPVLPAIHRAYTTWLAPQWSQMPRLPERNKKNLAAHNAIFEAILMRDPDAAEAALRAHLSDAWDQVRLTFTDL